MPEQFEASNTDQVIDLFAEAMHNKLRAMELENEALKLRLNEARVKLELARKRLEEAGADSSELEFETLL